jgi:hypothetical protein
VETDSENDDDGEDFQIGGNVYVEENDEEEN